MLCLLPPSLNLVNQFARFPPHNSCFLPPFQADNLIYLLQLITALPANNRKLADILNRTLSYMPLQTSSLNP